MFTKIYEKLKNFIKENYKVLLFLIISYIILTYPLPYYIYTAGGTINISDRVVVEDGYDSKGKLSFAYVGEIRATIPTYLLSKVIDDWEVVKVSDYKINENETVEEIDFRDRLSLEQANGSAIMVAYNLAGKKIDIVDTHHYIIYVDELAQTDLKIGDEIIAVASQKVSSLKDITTIISNYNENDEILIKVKNKNKISTKHVKVYKDSNDTLKVGIAITTLYDLKMDPLVTLNFKKHESGPSGGFMLTLAIYDKLMETDFTKGLNIVGTGTIDEEGRVGEIGGVKYKLKGAVKDKADIFFVPNGSNYEECIKLKKEKKYDIDIVGIDTFKDAIDYLQK